MQATFFLAVYSIDAVHTCMHTQAHAHSQFYCDDCARVYAVLLTVAICIIYIFGLVVSIQGILESANCPLNGTNGRAEGNVYYLY